MPMQNEVTIEVTPFQARMIAWWLQSYAPPDPTAYSLFGRAFSEALRDVHDVIALGRQFESIGARRRKGGLFGPVTVNVSREDALWLASKVRVGGMFGSRPRPYLPDAVALLCYRCASATMKKKGRPKLSGGGLDSAIEQQADKFDQGEIHDLRHLKRLKRRHRQENSMRQRAGILGSILLGGSKKSD